MTAADAAFDAFWVNVDDFTGRMTTNADLRRLAAAGTLDTRKVWHFGNQETWSGYVAKNTGPDTKHPYDYYRDYFWGKPGQEAPETAKLSREQKKALLPSLGARGITRYEQSVQRRQIEGGIQEGPLDIYAVESQQRGGGFFENIQEVRRTPPYGAAAEAKARRPKGW